MKANKLLKTLAASAMSLALLTGVAVMPAMAAGVTGTGDAEVGITGITVTDIVNTDGDTYAPNTTMTINVAEGSGKTFNDGTGNVTAAAGIAGGLTGTTIIFAPDASELGTSYTENGTLAVDDSVFNAPGVYHYVVSQAQGTYEGIEYDTTTYDVYLYVMNNAALNDLHVAYAVSVKTGETESKADIQFVNHYGDTNDTTHDVTVEKIVAGNFGNTATQDFTFNVSVTGTEGEIYKVVVDYDKNATNAGKDQTITINANAEAIPVTIKHNGTITIYGLSATDTYTIAETDVSGLGYTVTNSKTNDATGTVTGATTADDEYYTVTNTKTSTTPTGVILNVAPYALMVVIAVAGVAVFMRKRVED